jgi:uroporphyrinogen decarboxylase
MMDTTETLQNDLFLRVAKGEITDRPPVWLMRQAGRVLPQYRALRANFAGFREFLFEPAAAAEATIQPIDELGVDAAIIFSDILVVPEAMGLPYDMVEKRGPLFPKTIQTAQDIAQRFGITRIKASAWKAGIKEGYTWLRDYEDK